MKNKKRAKVFLHSTQEAENSELIFPSNHILILQNEIKIQKESKTSFKKSLHPMKRRKGKCSSFNTKKCKLHVF